MDMGRGEERVRCMEGIIRKLNVTICKVDRQKEFVLWEVVMDREACCAAVHVYKVSETA